MVKSNLVTLTQKDGVSVVTLNRPDRRNAINHALRVQLVATLRAANDEPATRAVILAGAGGHFCGGGDLTGMDDRDVASVHARMQMVAEVVGLIRQSRKPYIAAVEGSAFGAGLSLPLLCDQIVASTSAKFCAVFVRAGLTPDYGMMHLLPRRVGDGNARRMMMTGCDVSAEEAMRIGLVDRLVAEHGALDAAIACAREFTAHAPLAIQLMKGVMGDQRSTTLEATLRVEADLQAQLFQTTDFDEVIDAFKSRRAPVFQGR